MVAVIGVTVPAGGRDADTGTTGVAFVLRGLSHSHRLMMTGEVEVPAPNQGSSLIVQAEALKPWLK